MPDYARRLIDSMYAGGAQDYRLPYTPYDKGPLNMQRLSQRLSPPATSSPAGAQKKGVSPGGLLKKAKTASNIAKYMKGGPTSGSPFQTLGNTKMYLSGAKSALSTGVGDAGSWYAGLQAGEMGVNEGTQLALIEGSYGPAADYVAAEGVGTVGGELAAGELAGTTADLAATESIASGALASEASTPAAAPAMGAGGPLAAMTAAATMHYWAPPIFQPIADELGRLSRKVFGEHKSYTLPKKEADAYIKNMIGTYGAKLGRPTSSGRLLYGPAPSKSQMNAEYKRSWYGK